MAAVAMATAATAPLKERKKKEHGEDRPGEPSVTTATATMPLLKERK